MKSNINIYAYSNYLNYIREVVTDCKKKKYAPKSLGEWALRLGYQSPRSFGMVIKGERLPSEEMLETLSSYLKLSLKERNYLYLLVKIEKKRKKNLPIEDCLERLQNLNPHINQFVEINPISFSYIAKWYHLVIKELLRGNKIFKEDYKELVRLLRNKISISEAKEAICNLIKVGVVKKDYENGTLISKDMDITTSNDIPNEAIKLHHIGMLNLAKEALYEQDQREREFQAFTVKMNPLKMKEAKEEIRSFISEFNRKFGDENDLNVYQLNINLFSHTNNERIVQ